MAVAVSILLALASDVLAGAIYNPPRLAAYESGEVHRAHMSLKRKFWDDQEAIGAYNSSRYLKVEDYTPCVNGSCISAYRDKSDRRADCRHGEGV